MDIDEQFEAWFASKFPKINAKASDPTDPVRGQVKEVARYAWKYSREDVEIVLPQAFDIGIAEPHEAMDAEEVRAALKAAGLKVK